MESYRKLDEDLFYVGFSDRRIELFENLYPVPEGVSYNSYLLLDKKTALFDTVDHSVSEKFILSVKELLGKRKLDYLIVNHVEPDHSATIKEILMAYPNAKVVCTKQAKILIEQFFDLNLTEKHFDIDANPELVLGSHTLTFAKTPMVHWPEVMVTFDKLTGTLFSADAFGSFGALSGDIYADDIVFDAEIKEMYRRYYANIVGKFGNFVQNALSSLAKLGIKRIFPLHGRIWRKNLGELISLYDKWSKYEAEEQGVVIAYASIYGNTEFACNVLANELACHGVKVKMFDVSKTDSSYILSTIMKYDRIVFASATHNLNIFPKMEDLLNEVVQHNIQNKTFAIIENGSWAPTAGGQMKNKLLALKNNNFIETSLTIKFALKNEQLEVIKKISDELAR